MNNTFATITPTRGDRPELLERCKAQLQRQTLQPTKSYFIDYAPLGGAVDLVPRIISGIDQAKRDGIDRVFIWEDDDYYAPCYLDTMMAQAAPNMRNFIGHESTVYYNLRTQTFEELPHRGRASLFTTSFCISQLDKFVWPDDDYPFLDLKIWAYARRRRLPRVLMPPTGFYRTGLEGYLAVGMKHGTGLCGGAGHTMQLAEKDPELYALWRYIYEEEDFIYYRDLMNKNGWRK